MVGGENKMDNLLEIARVVAGSIYVLYLPGYVLSFIFMKRGSIDAIERVAISFALSISVVPLVVFYINMLGVSITAISIFLEILGILTVSIGYLYYTNIYKYKHDVSKI